ncbi:MAG: phosphotransferase enzyme family protein [Mycobacterium leprae]
MDAIHDLPDAWGLPRPWAVTANDGGINNLNYRVDTPAGAYFLKLYQNTADPVRITYEFDLLTRLEQVGLSFQVPVPMPTPDGKRLVTVETPTGTSKSALFRLIPGGPVAKGNLAHALASGAAYGELDAALARIPVDFAASPHAGWDRLDRVHPAVLDPEEALTAIPGGRQLLPVLAMLQERVPALYARLPRQLIHADPARANVLLADNRVTGILDFEFAAPDRRLIDFLAVLYTFGAGLRDELDPWPLMEAAARGYAAFSPLTAFEIEAVPTIWRLSRMVSLLHWAGRERAGLSPQAATVERVESTAAFDQWLAAHEERLQANLLAWQSPPSR